MFNSKKPKVSIKVSHLNKYYSTMSDAIVRDVGSKLTLPKKSKSFSEKAFVLHFKGNVRAESVENLREEISAIILAKQRGVTTDKVLIKLDSTGGTVTGYGLVADQINRLKKHGFTVTAVIDQVAASGGYMAAVVSDKIIATPNSVIGSVGVVANMPMVEDLLNKIGVEFNEYTAGEYKRDVTPYRRPSDDAVNHLNEHLARIHQQFKDHISEHRDNVDVESISTGEVWSGKEALDKNLIDEIGVYDEVVMDWITKYDVMKVKVEFAKDKKGFGLRFGSQIIDHLWEKFETLLYNNRIM